MNKLTDKTLAQIVNGNHQAAAIFEKYHLDFCCKGKRSLQQACAEQQLPVGEIAAELETVLLQDSKSSKWEFDKLSLTQLAEYIVSTHHDYVKKETSQIFGYLQKVASKHGDRHPELFKVFELFAAIKEEMEGHMKKEELILFPRIKELEKLAQQQQGQFSLNISYLLSPITIMQQEHDHAGNMMEEIRLLTNNYTPPSDACTTYRLSFTALQAFEKDLHQHVHLENNILFPEAIKAFRKLQTAVLN